MSNKRPNILIICSDQQRYDTLGCYGNSFTRTPNLDGLAQEGVLFERAYCQNPVCTPSRASFMTGRYPRTTCCRQNGQDIPEREVLFSKLLADGGYTCGLCGKFHLSACEPSSSPRSERRIDDGFHYFEWTHASSHRQPTNAYQLWLRERGVPYQVTPMEECRYVQKGMPAQWHQTTFCTSKAMNFIDSCGEYDDPWMFVINYFDPHAAFDPPEEYIKPYLERLEDIPLPNFTPEELEDKPVIQKEEYYKATNSKRFYSGKWYSYPAANMTEQDHRYIKAAYWAMCDLIDDQVGRLLDHLKESGQAENTLVVYMSDHGELLGDHGMYYKGPFFYEPSVRVPFIFSWPGNFQSGKRCGVPVELIDLAPTLLEAAGIEIPAYMQGKSLYPYLCGQEDTPPVTDVYCEYYNSLPWNEPHIHATMVLDDRYKLVLYHTLQDGELYDLQQDPIERVNRWRDPAFASIRQEMLVKLCNKMAWTVDPLPMRHAPW
ncbi:MAG: sulfatase [Eubacteriales bacterium]|jgi:arylsulfatase